MDDSLVKLESYSNEIDDRQGLMSLEIVTSPDASSSEFEISNVDKAIEFIELLTGDVQGTEYSTDEDQKELKRLRAQANKFTSSIKSEMKEYEKRLFENARAELKRLDSSVVSFVRVLQDKIDECESVYRKEKNELIQNSFNEALLYSDVDAEIEELFDPKWLNRSMSIKKITESISSMVEKIESLSKIVGSQSKAKEMLKETNWNLEKSLLQFQEEKEAANAVESEEVGVEFNEKETQQTENEVEVEDENPAEISYSVKVPSDEAVLFERQMDAFGWKYKREV